MDEKLKPEIEELLSQSRIFNKNGTVYIFGPNFLRRLVSHKIAIRTEKLKLTNRNPMN